MAKFKLENELTDEKIEEMLEDPDSVDYKEYQRIYFEGDCQEAFDVALGKFQAALNEKIDEL